MSLFRKKSLAKVIAEAGDPNRAEHGHEPQETAQATAKDGAAVSGGLKRSLGAFNLAMLGVGAIIGAGIFSLTGTAAAQYAGPGIVFSFVVGGVLCALAGLCYAELASMIPVAGSAYAYTYTTMGELIAWIVGWDLVLEYAFGAVTVSEAWSGYLYSLLHKNFGIDFGDTLIRFTKGPFETVELASGAEVAGFWNVPATFVALLAASVIYRGIKEAAWVNNLIVVVKVAIVLVFVLLGIGVVSGDNLFVNEGAGGLGALVPAAVETAEGSRYGWGLGGVLTGAGVVFFAYIGFDAVSTTAQETRNPKRDLPIGILSSLVICTVLYVGVAIVLTGVVHYSELDVADPIAVGIDRIVELRGWSPGAQKMFTATVKIGALAGLTSVILVMMLGQTRIFYAISRDGLLPWFHRTHDKHHTPHVATAVTGVFVAICGGFIPIHLVGELVSIGTLLAFVLVCLGVPILRRTEPDVKRAFKVPAPWLIGGAGALACAWVMAGLPLDTWLRLLIWLAIGFAIYFGYGRRHSVLSKSADTTPEA